MLRIGTSLRKAKHEALRRYLCKKCDMYVRIIHRWYQIHTYLVGSKDHVNLVSQIVYRRLRRSPKMSVVVYSWPEVFCTGVFLGQSHRLLFRVVRTLS